jgi:ureidoglycolate lyase
VSTITLAAAPLTAAGFLPYGEVVEARGAGQLINRGTTRQFADLARVDVGPGQGRPRISLYRAAPCAMPLLVTMLERHPLASQLFMPLGGAPFLVVVATGAGEVVEPSALRAFLSDGRQGVNYRRGTWHHPLIAVGRENDFLVLDRAGSGENCDEFFFAPDVRVVVDLPPPRGG